jgi:hypothetical protein
MSKDNGSARRSVFELVDVIPDEAASAVLGVWEPVSAAEVASFGLAAGESPVPIWRADLPADPKSAAEELAHGRQASAAAQIAIAGTEARFFAVLARSQNGPEAGDSFAAAASPAAEVELLSLLHELQHGQAETSFGLGDVLSERWPKATQQFQAFLHQVMQHVAYSAWVETRIAGNLLGWTTVSLTGDMDTAWAARLGPEQVTLHQETVALALLTRAHLMRTFTSVARAAAELAKLATLIGTPGGAILALPAAWRFFNLMLDELRMHQSAPKEI